MATKKRSKSKSETYAQYRKRILRVQKQIRSMSNPRKIKGKSTTLKNMASVTVTKLPNGVVKITGRKMAAGKANPRRGAYVISDAGMEFQRTYRTKAAAMKAAARFRRQGYSKLKIRKR